MVSITDQQMTGGAACVQTRWETFGQSLGLVAVAGRWRCWKGSSLSHGFKKPNGIAWGRRNGTSCFCYYVSAHNLKKKPKQAWNLIYYTYILLATRRDDPHPTLTNYVSKDWSQFYGAIWAFLFKMFNCLFSVWPDVTGLPTLKRAWRQSSAEWWGICEVRFKEDEKKRKVFRICPPGGATAPAEPTAQYVLYPAAQQRETGTNFSL